MDILEQLNHQIGHGEAVSGSRRLAMGSSLITDESVQVVHLLFEAAALTLKRFDLRDQFVDQVLDTSPLLSKHRHVFRVRILVNI